MSYNELTATELMVLQETSCREFLEKIDDLIFLPIIEEVLYVLYTIESPV